ncbi:hypothetical protein ABW636_10865 [Aquimarina sp. 2201CG1-2-11]|uniref:hypothetical protein n=1 Tax=Aquimarina discodermiae TaxID=3231043 RepID=UPI0034625F58
MRAKHNIIVISILAFVFAGFKSTPNHPQNTVDHFNSSFQDTKEKLIGKWIMDGDPDTYIELNADGTALEKSIGDPLKRYWSIKDNSLCLKATPNQGGTEICLAFKLNMNTLILTMNGMKLHYVRYNLTE